MTPSWRQGTFHYMPTCKTYARDRRSWSTSTPLLKENDLNPGYGVWAARKKWTANVSTLYFSGLKNERSLYEPRCHSKSRTSRLQNHTLSSTPPPGPPKESVLRQIDKNIAPVYTLTVNKDDWKRGMRDGGSDSEAWVGSHLAIHPCYHLVHNCACVRFCLSVWSGDQTGVTH